MNSLKLLAAKYVLKISTNTDEQFVRGRAGRIIWDEGDCVMKPDDLDCVADGPLTEASVLEFPIFDPTDDAQAELAVEVIEAGERPKLTSAERRTKIEALIQLRIAQADCSDEGGGRS